MDKEIISYKIHFLFQVAFGILKWIPMIKSHCFLQKPQHLFLEVV